MSKLESGLLSEYPLYLFNEGTNYYSYKTMGAHPLNDGYLFSVWAPNASSVSVVGDFNSWNVDSHHMKFHEKFGVWELFVPNLGEDELYKFYVRTRNGEGFYKADPFAFKSELRPNTASVTTRLDKYAWNDDAYVKKRVQPHNDAVIIYEIHVGSWRKKENGDFYNYRELADLLVGYVKDMGFTHVELMPICEHPYDESWGYQVTGYYSVTSRYGSASDFKYFVDKCHQNNIGVILDWVPAHFPKDEHGLSCFDGSCLYEYQDTRIGEHLEWGTKVFNCQRAEVMSFLISNAMFWFDEFHIDGLRVDAVSSMLYRDYNRRSGQWIPNKYGGKENLEAVDMMRRLNTVVFAKHPGVMMIAEESTAWANVTKPVDCDGLGFNFKWNMGWMNDILKYMSIDPYFRRDHHAMLTFSMHYAFAENYILPVSHDEVVHGKKSLIDKMSGDYYEKFSSLRAFYAYMMAHPGKKLIFMGGEFAQFSEWCVDRELDWCVLEYEKHQQMQVYFKALLDFYKKNKALWQNDRDWNGYQWINTSDYTKNIISFIRINNTKREKIIVVCNFSGVDVENYSIGVPQHGTYEEIFNSNWEQFGGHSPLPQNKILTLNENCDEFENKLIIPVLPKLSTVFYKKSADLDKSSYKHNDGVPKKSNCHDGKSKSKAG